MDLYDISQYSDEELYRMLDLDHPSDRELEAKIISLLHKYQEMANPMGVQMYQFFNNVYHHFFEDDDDEEEEDTLEDTQPNNEINELTQEGFANPSPSDPEIKQSGTWTGANIDIVSSEQASRGTAITKNPKQKAGVASDNIVQIGTNENYGSAAKTSTVGFQKSLEYTKGTLNPILKETIQRVISIDSQFRDVNVYPYSTDFTFNLSDTLQDVVSLKLYSVQIPYTWYTVSNAYGSNFIYLNGNAAGIASGNYDIMLSIPSGNYQAADLVLALRTAIQSIKTEYPDVNFGTTDICYNYVNSRATLVLDIQQIYNESYYYVNFPLYIPPLIDQFFMNFANSPYMYFKCVHPMYTDTVHMYNDISLNIPSPPNDSLGQNADVVGYGYDISGLFQVITTAMNTPYTNRLGSTYDFTKSIVSLDISQNFDLNVNMIYRIPATNHGQANFRYNFLSNNGSWNPINLTTADSSDRIISSDTGFSTLNVNNYDPNTNSDISLNDAMNTRLTTSWYDPIIRRFHDCCNNDATFDISSGYFYDVSSLVIQIQSIGLNNYKVPAVNIPVIITEMKPNYTGDEVINKLNQTLANNARQLWNNYRIQINTGAFTYNPGAAVLHFDTSISAILTAPDYTTYLYDPNGFPQTSTNAYVFPWINIQNFWYNYLSISDTMHVLANSPDIRGSAPLINIPATKTDQISSLTIQNSIQEFLGFADMSYNLTQWKSNKFLGSEYNSCQNFPFISNAVMGSSAFRIRLYQPTITTTTQTYDYQDGGQDYLYDLSYLIMYSGISMAVQYNVSFQNIIEAVNQSFKSQGVFTSNTGISIIDYNTGKQVTTLIDNAYYAYQLTVQLDRKRVVNAVNMKTCIDINDTTIWLNYFHFTTSTDVSRVELSDLYSENKVLANTYDVYNQPYIYFRCITPGYAGFPTNDISLSIPVPNSWIQRQVGYTITDYLTALQTALTIPTWGLSGTADLDGSGGTFRMGVNISHIIPATSEGISNFSVDFSQSVFAIMNPNHTWIIDSSNTSWTFDNLVFSDTYSINSTNDTIKITVQGQYQGGVLAGSKPSYLFNGEISPFPWNEDLPHPSNVFYTYFYIPHGTYTVTQLIQVVNTYVFGQNVFSQSAYGNDTTKTVDTHKNMVSFDPTDISNGRVSMYGSNMSIFINQKDIVQNQIRLQLSIRSILTNHDYHMEFYNPDSYQLNTSTVPGMNIPAASYFNYCNINALVTTVDYTAPIVPNNTNGWTDVSNSWYSHLSIPYPSYILAYQPMNTNTKYSYIYGKESLVDQKLFLTVDNNYFTIRPNYDDRGGVYVVNPSEYTGVTSDQNDIKVMIDLPVKVLYNSDEIINALNRSFTANPVTYGSYLYIDQITHIAKMRLNINKIFTASDYSIVVYDQNIFTHCSYGSSSSLETVTQETTLGWLLGFRNLPIYDLNSTWVTYYNQQNKNKHINYVYDENTRIVFLTGDTSVSITLYNYFLIVLDDYTQNHLNDGLVTVNSPAMDIALPSYANRNRHRCNMELAQSNGTVDPNQITYIGNSRDYTNYNNLTMKQLYSANQILNNQQRNSQTSQTSLGIYVQDVFGIIPMKTSGLINGQSYIEFGGTLQNQERIYFGPVNIKRMSVRILTDKGNILNLNNANFSFSLIAQQLYNPNKG